LKIAVIMGGVSAERAVSLNTGDAIVKACKAIGHIVIPVTLEDTLGPLIPELKQADLVFNALHGGQGENGVIQGFFESLGIPYTGSGPLSSALCMDKHFSKSIAHHNGILTPFWQCVRSVEVTIDPERFKYPLVVKPNDQGSTVGISIVRQEEDLRQAIESALRYSESVIIENFIAGRELTVTILGDEVYPIVEIIPSHEVYDYECKYIQGLTEYICPANLSEAETEDIQKTAMDIFRLFHCRHYGRVDFRFDSHGKAWFLEVNTLPGMTATSLVPKAAKASGVSFEELVHKIITEATET